MTTIVCRIDLATVRDLDSAIVDLCRGQAIAGRKLAATFTYQTQLVLVFQGGA